ncbi:MAG TPA: HAMP domain-containing sensor histidine kinase [Solirubrobacteraceae bacterium]|nr:HAMP domain-containing sensor histidine kinase [Solirubrobacteraceae bacterium]
MIGRTSIRWRLVAWVSGVLVMAAAVIFVVVYERTGQELRNQIDHDVAADVTELQSVVRALGPRDPRTLLADIGGYLRAQPYSGTSSLLFASIPGHGSTSNHPELIGGQSADDGESASQQSQENTLEQALLSGPTGVSTRHVADVGKVRVKERIVRVGGLRVRIGAGEPLEIVERAEHGVARSFVIAGALALLLALIASYLAGASLSLPLRRMARVAARVDEGDLHPRMQASSLGGSEVRVLAESFNHMLDRLGAAFAAQREFIADASHELRTPLTVIGGQLEVLAAQERPDPEEVRRVERLVAGEIARMSRLVDDMLLLARSERQDFLQCKEFELEPFVSELWWGASVSDERHFELGPIPNAKLTADPDRLAQALRNLIRNAVEHTAEPHGLVRLEVQSRPGGRVRFVVMDDGPGIAAEQLESVFERFHRTDSARDRKAGGAGLGLAIVRAIAEAHDGTARAVATATGGARLELELPGLHDERTPAPQSRVPVSRTSAH